MIQPNPFCVVDVESTGLDSRIHQPYEVAWWRHEEQEPSVLWLPHTLDHADPKALEIGHYWDRTGYPWTDPRQGERERTKLIRALRDVTLVGSNPDFDARMLTRFIGAPVWHHRTINVADGAMWIFGWDRPKGLGDVAERLRAEGFDIPDPDHTSEGDVRTTMAVYLALRDLSARTSGGAQ